MKKRGRESKWGIRTIFDCPHIISTPIANSKKRRMEQGYDYY
jgi:hypothetical protein